MRGREISKALWVVAAMLFFESTASIYDGVYQRAFEGAQARTLFFSPDGKTLYAGGSDVSSPDQKHGWLWAWNTSTGRVLWKTRIPESTYPRKLSPDGGTLLVEPPDGRLQFWDTATGQLRCTLETGPPREMLEKVQFTADSQRLLGSFQSGVQTWSVRTGRQKSFWKIPVKKNDWLYNIQFSANGERVLVGVRGSASTVQLWDSKNGRSLRTFKEASSAWAISPSGTRVAFVYSAPSSPALSWVVVHDALSGVLKIQSTEFSPNFNFDSLEFVSENSLLCKGIYGQYGAGGKSQTYLWDIRQDRMVEQPIPREYSIFSPDKRLQATPNRGGYKDRPSLVTIYDAGTGLKLRDLEGLAGR